MVAEKGPPPGKLVPELEALLGFWRRLYGTKPIPGRSRFDAAELKPWGRNIVWIEAGDGVFRLRSFGIDLIRRFGRHAADHSVDELAQDIAASLRETLWRSVATAAPVAAMATVQLGRQAAVFSDLVLPVSSDGRRISLLLLASYELGAPL